MSVLLRLPSHGYIFLDKFFIISRYKASQTNLVSALSLSTVSCCWHCRRAISGLNIDDVSVSCDSAADTSTLLSSAASRARLISNTADFKSSVGVMKRLSHVSMRNQGKYKGNRMYICISHYELITNRILYKLFLSEKKSSLFFYDN